jgi:hypothetical protein
MKKYIIGGALVGSAVAAYVGVSAYSAHIQQDRAQKIVSGAGIGGSLCELLENDQTDVFARNEQGLPTYARDIPSRPV